MGRAVEFFPIAAEAVLIELEEIVSRHRNAAGNVPLSEQGKVAPADKARAIYRARRGRAKVFVDDADLFADPAWDLLLDLFAARESNRPMSISSACIAAAVPPTTGLRWVARLEKRGLLERRADPSDERRSTVDLSSRAYSLMHQWMRVWARG